MNPVKFILYNMSRTILTLINSDKSPREPFFSIGN